LFHSFQKIVEAYVVLKDDNKRKAYDTGTLNEMFSDDDDDDHYDSGFSGSGARWCPDCGTWHFGGGESRRSGPSFSSFFNAYFASQFGYGNAFFAEDFDRYYFNRRDERRRGGGSSRRPPPSTKAPPPPLKKPDASVDETMGVVTISWPNVEYDATRQDLPPQETFTTNLESLHKFGKQKLMCCRTYLKVCSGIRIRMILIGMFRLSDRAVSCLNWVGAIRTMHKSRTRASDL
jgi:curved DNA-binding protein CbpA